MHRKIVLFIFLILFLLRLPEARFAVSAAVSQSAIRVPDDYQTIQEAINAANSGDTIYVASGTYYEHVIINKSLRLIGEYNRTIITTLDPQYITFTYWGFVVNVTADNVEISQFRIRGAQGISLYHCNNNIIADNIIRNKYIGLSLVFSNSNIITGNTFYSNNLGLQMVGSANNTIFHNNFIDNIEQIQVSSSFANWDNGEEGNYWSNYLGLDSNGDGIGDTPAIIDALVAHAQIRDIYPLMIPWNPQGLLSSLSISCNPSTTYTGFKVNINGRLAYVNGSAISGPRIILSYSVTNGTSWNDITSVTAESDGNYSAQWIPPATGIFIVKAAWAGDVSHGIWRASAKVYISVIPFAETYVFSVVSNSTVSALAFNSTSRELSFTVSGPSGTTGYVDVTIAKSLIVGITALRIYLNGTETSYAITSTDGSWLIHFTYHHSVFSVIISLGPIKGAEIGFPYTWELFGIIAVVGIGLAAIILWKRKFFHKIGVHESQ